MQSSKKTLEAGTCNRKLALLRHMLHKAIDWGYLGENPCEKVKPFKEPPGRIRWLSDRERERLLDAVESRSEVLYGIVLTALLTGMRKGELQELTWDNVDFEREEITLTRTKNNERRVIPICQELLPVLQALRDAYPHAHHVFSKPDGRPYGNWRKAFESACREAGVKDFHFHDLRHTFASYLAMEKCNVPTIQRLTGHKSLSCVQRYMHLSEAHLRAAVDQLGAKVVQSEEASEGQSSKPNEINAPVAQTDRASDF
ncbi:site-specific integrase [candidate division WOR-3 bacterium]|nr:site-specific integrase [candidate division WOR-3 bacterium]